MNTEKSTPRPYIVTETFGDTHHIKGTMPVIRFGDCIDSVIVSLGAPKDQCEARAALIVQAVNEYEALCAVAEAAIKFVAKCDRGEARSTRSYAEFCKGLSQLAAIRKGGGK